MNGPFSAVPAKTIRVVQCSSMIVSLLDDSRYSAMKSQAAALRAKWEEESNALDFRIA